MTWERLTQESRSALKSTNHRDKMEFLRRMVLHTIDATRAARLPWNARFWRNATRKWHRMRQALAALHRLKLAFDRELLS